MSNVSWYPETPSTRKDFFIRTFPMFVALIVFFYFGLDWMGAFEFLEVLVRDNSAWLLQVIFGLSTDDFTVGYANRRDLDIFTGGIVFFSDEFPAIVIHGYPKTLLIIRACTGMEAGALLMALITVTPAKWYNKVIAQVTNLLMMHIGNTFRVAFHFWFTRYLYFKFLDQGMDITKAADQAFYYAHDLLSKVFGFVGIVIFTLVIERTGVKIVSTFGAWMDAIGEGIKRLTWKIQGDAYYIKKTGSKDNSNSETITKSVEEKITEKIPLNVEKVFFYPTKEIEKNKWKFTGKTFSIFALISGALLCLGLIPSFSALINNWENVVASDWFGAQIHLVSKEKIFWWYTSFDNVTELNFTVDMFGTGLGLAAFMIGLIFVTPTDWIKRLWATLITIVVVFPANIFLMGFRRWAIWSLTNNPQLKSNHPLMYLNFADILKGVLPVVFWLMGFALLMYIFYKLDIKSFTIVYIWLHQLYFLFLNIVGLRKKEKKDEIFSDGSEDKSSTDIT